MTAEGVVNRLSSAQITVQPREEALALGNLFERGCLPLHPLHVEDGRVEKLLGGDAT